MRRGLMWLIVIVLLLLAGAAINHGVAWACAAWSAPANDDTPDFSMGRRADGSFRATTTRRTFGHTRENYGVFANLTLDPTNTYTLAAEWKLNAGHYCESRVGWPLRAFRCRNNRDVEMRIGRSKTAISRRYAMPTSGGIKLTPFSTGSAASAWRALPYQPIWPGVIANTLFYCVLLAGALFGPAHVQRAARRSRGVCPKCAYPAGQSAACSECGASLHRVRRRDFSSDCGDESLRSARRIRLVRTAMTGMPMLLGGGIAAVYLVRALVAYVQDTPKWDDHGIMGLAWLTSGVGSAITVRLILAVIWPERWLPRWLATVLLVLIAIGAGVIGIYMMWAAAWGPCQHHTIPHQYQSCDAIWNRHSSAHWCRLFLEVRHTVRPPSRCRLIFAEVVKEILHTNLEVDLIRPLTQMMRLARV